MNIQIRFLRQKTEKVQEVDVLQAMILLSFQDQSRNGELSKKNLLRHPYPGPSAREGVLIYQGLLYGQVLAAESWPSGG